VVCRIRARAGKGCGAFAEKEIGERINGWQLTTANKYARQRIGLAGGLFLLCHFYIGREQRPQVAQMPIKKDILAQIMSHGARLCSIATHLKR
jgi:hypothetical protein